VRLPLKGMQQIPACSFDRLLQGGEIGTVDVAFGSWLDGRVDVLTAGKLSSKLTLLRS